MPDSAPSGFPKLTIVPTGSLLPHEEHDEQRARPLIARLREETHMINPPIVTPIGDSGRYAILDGANRAHAFAALGYPHILVQVVQYGHEVSLHTWHHLVCIDNGSSLSADDFTRSLMQLPQVAVTDLNGMHATEKKVGSVAVVQFHEHEQPALHVGVPAQHAPTLEYRNTALRHFVQCYQAQATLQRTASPDWEENRALYPTALALIQFSPYQPGDILDAALSGAYLPPGVSRHIVQGRAVQVHYPMDVLRDNHTPLEAKNEALAIWIQAKAERRQIRYYAESTYQFSE